MGFQKAALTKYGDVATSAIAKIERLVMPKDYHDGYALGEQDGANGNNRLALRAVERLLRIGAYLPGGSARDDEFMEGYKAGFRDKVRKIQTIPAENVMPENLGRGDQTDEARVERDAKRAKENRPNTEDPRTPTSEETAGVVESTRAATHAILNGEPSMSGNSFAHQIELLLNLKQYLSKFQERLLEVSASYQHKLDELRAAGMMEETYARYVQNELAQTQAEIARLVEHISANDLPKVQKEIDFLSQH